MMTCEKAHKKVLDVFQNEISTYVIGDLEKLGRIQNDPTCAVPESLAVFAVLDWLGFLMRPLEPSEQQIDTEDLLKKQLNQERADDATESLLSALRKERNATTVNLNYMLENWLGSVRAEYRDAMTRIILLKLFRHGGTHQFLPKAAGIGKFPEDSRLVFFQESDEWQIPVLNENRLRDDFLEMLNLIERVIDEQNETLLKESVPKEPDITIHDLVMRMNARLDLMLYWDRTELISILKKHDSDKLPPALRPGREPTKTGPASPPGGPMDSTPTTTSGTSSTTTAPPHVWS